MPIGLQALRADRRQHGEALPILRLGDRGEDGQVLRTIAPGVAALAGDGNRWVTGQRIEVSHGVHL
jgi:NAD(P)-dependent dehydrogenase (short-subunit alcohol dehydrogenase family)